MIRQLRTDALGAQELIECGELAARTGANVTLAFANREPEPADPPRNVEFASFDDHADPVRAFLERI
jgi:hypothetical protein